MKIERTAFCKIEPYDIVEKENEKKYVSKQLQ